MQKRVMATMSFDPARLTEIMARVPAERTRVRELIAQGIVEALYLDNARNRAWLVLRVETEEEARRVMESLPLHDLSTMSRRRGVRTTIRARLPVVAEQ